MDYDLVADCVECINRIVYIRTAFSSEDLNPQVIQAYDAIMRGHVL